MFESIHDLLRFLVKAVRGHASEADVQKALEFIDAHEDGTDGSIADRPVPALTPAEEEQLAALQAKQGAKEADTARRAAGGTHTGNSAVTWDPAAQPAGPGGPDTPAATPGEDS
jgi:hypothetical protein